MLPPPRYVSRLTCKYLDALLIASIGLAYQRTSSEDDRSSAGAGVAGVASR